MRLVDDFGGDDDRSMAADNTSAFNCRPSTGSPGEWSQHSYGRAIDVNPRENPYVSGSTVLPPTGAPYVDRSLQARGLIRPDGPVVRAFTAIGWTWGGTTSWRRTTSTSRPTVAEPTAGSTMPRPRGAASRDGAPADGTMNQPCPCCRPCPGPPLRLAPIAGSPSR